MSSSNPGSSSKRIYSVMEIYNFLTNSDSDESDKETQSTVCKPKKKGDEKDAEAAQERRMMRELKLLNTKVRSFRGKQKNALKERQKLRELIKRQQKALRDEKRKYRLLQKEVDKMAKLMKDEVDEDETDENDKERPEEETETESDDSEESEEEEEDSQDDEVTEDVSHEEKKRFLNSRVKKYENRLSSLKKGNYLMKANIDRLQDDLNRQKEMSISLQEDLNSVLEELG